ncbi:hypothetical protein Q3G72_000758 [Acer saccharum]|nr:hypothetical protein Q3G72_000758 [Acer saccharum]
MLLRKFSERTCIDRKLGSHINSDEIDDGILQHWSLWRDLEIVMVNGLMPWGNRQLLPLRPLREPLTALKKADASVIHNADLDIETIRKRLGELEGKFGSKPIVVVTEKRMLRGRLQVIVEENFWNRNDQVNLEEDLEPSKVLVPLKTAN